MSFQTPNWPGKDKPEDYQEKVVPHEWDAICFDLFHETGLSVLSTADREAFKELDGKSAVERADAAKLRMQRETEEQAERLYNKYGYTFDPADHDDAEDYLFGGWDGTT